MAIKLKKRSDKVPTSKDFSLTGLIYHANTLKQKLRLEDPEEQKYRKEGFHLSQGIASAEDDSRYCSREIEITRRFPKEVKPWIPSKELQITFDVGNELHRMIQSYVRDMGALYNKSKGFYGRWVCRRCEHIWMTFAPIKCPKCKSKLHSIKYLEFRFSGGKYDVATTTDGLLWIYDDVNEVWDEWVVEIKTIKQSGNYYGDIGFNELVEPLPKHYMQAQGYANLRRLQHKAGMITAKGKPRKLPYGFTEWPKLKGVIFLYIDKNSGRFKEYQLPVKIRPWKVLASRITVIQEREKEKTFSPRIKLCTDLKSAKKICGVADLCFDKKKTGSAGVRSN